MTNEDLLPELQTWLRFRADNLPAVAVQTGGTSINRRAAPNHWGFVSTRDRNRAGQETIHRHLYLAVAEREQLSKLLHEYSRLFSSNTTIPNGATMCRNIVATSERIKRHFAKAREYMLSFYQDRFSMNLTRGTRVRSNVTTEAVASLYRNLDIRDFQPVQYVNITGGNSSANHRSRFDRINRELRVVNLVFRHFEDMIRCMNQAI